MEKIKWIYFVIIFTVLQSGGNTEMMQGPIQFPDSFEKTKERFNVQSLSSSSSGVKTSGTKTYTSSRSSSRSSVSEPLMSKTVYSTGSSSAGQSGSDGFNMFENKQNSPQSYNIDTGQRSGGNSGSSYSSSSASSSSSSFGSNQNFAGCNKNPNPVLNAKLKCQGPKCKAECLPGYQFPSKVSFMELDCINGLWVIKNSNSNNAPICEPICLPQCQNNGICIEPSLCQCPQNYHGTSCQNEKKFCLQTSAWPKNSKRTCTQSMCTITCMTGNRFPDNSQSMNLQCVDGKWIPNRQDLMIIPDCEPICNSKCQNGGSCLSYNVCQCKASHRGPQCQYSVDRCNPKMLNFNGGYNCTGSGDVLSCKIYCPDPIPFEYTPSDIYNCNYADGEFMPRAVPQCVFPEGMEVFRSPLSEGSGFQEGIKKPSIHKKPFVAAEGDADEEDEIEEEITVVRKVIKKQKNKTITYDDEEFFAAPGVYSLYMSQNLSVTYKTPKASACMTWNGNKVTTFDGVTYSNDLVCSHTLVKDYIDGTFDIILRSCPYDSPQPCPHALEVFIQNEQYTFEKVNGQVKMSTTKRQFSIPAQISGLKVSRSGVDVRIILEAIPITIIWNSDKYVQIEASPSIWNRTAGLCGTMDGILTNDFMSKDRTYHKLASTFVDSWKALNLDKNKDKCQPKSQQLKSECETSVQEKADLVCTDLLKNRKMENCMKMYDQDLLMKTCISDYCDCKNTYERTQCICNGFSALAKDCQFNGIMLPDGWRDWQICPLNCSNGRVYRSCGPINEPSCGSAIEDNQFNCREGCFCPDNTMLYDGTCVKQEQCPCKLRGKTFPPKSEITRDCNTCTCRNGVWTCTSLTCGSRCAAIGDPHYVTFDGKKYDFMGKCSYYLMQTNDLTVEAENVVCSGAISENMNLLPSFSSELPSCTKSLTIKFKDNGKMKTIKLKQGGFVLVDGFEVSKLPKEVGNGGVKIVQASSTFILVDFQDGVRIWWDGITRAYIDAPSSYRGKTKGLCGTFNDNMKDDFLTPEGDIETIVSPFANKWQTKESCEFLNNDIVPHPCQANVEMKDKADKICSKIKEKVFEECHWLVDPESFHIDCLFDVCACKGDINQCGCPILASYAAECIRQGTVLNWRHKVSECNVNCPLGQIFDQCGEPYTRTCTSLQSETASKIQCVEGCRCPQGQALDENNECVTVAMCKCTYKNMEFKPGHKEVRPGKKSQQLCTCTGAKWVCVEAKPDDAINYPPASDMSNKCAATKNEVFTTCEPANPITCKNMHTYMQSSTALCRPGCTCKEGFVLDSILKLCVLPEKCSCHHGGRSYNDGETMKEECNTCVCKAGSWDCSKKNCGSTCSSWGDSHFQTFDGREFDFQGVCNYVLSKGKLDDNDGFSVTIQNVLCGSNGVTCSKSLNIAVVGLESEIVTLTSEQAGYKSKSGNALKKIFVHRSGIFLIVEIPHIGVLIKWDRGTRVYVKLESRWKGRVQGLCGNNNYDSKDDFMNPSSGIEQNPIVFGHSWKLDDSCATPTEQADACALNPERNVWAQRKCGLLKSNVFAACHSEVPIDSFWKRCIFDTCSCDQGGDCECLCTALSAYAYACSAKGVNIKWRTPDLCPMQCDPTCSNYSPCIPSCSVETCDNLIQQLSNERMCKEDTCVEGCALKGCEKGMVYMNDSYTECVPKSTCKPVCLQINGKIYYEGDTITSDSCHTCTCTRNKRKCIGKPCAPKTSTPSTPALSDGDLKCITGWSGWFNQDVLDQSEKPNVKTSKSNYFKEDDIEPLPSDMQMKNIPGNGNAVCPSKMIAAVECRTVMDHKSPKATQQDVECSLERGLVCKGQCFDYEIRVLCDCGDNELVPTQKPTQKPTFSPPVFPIIPPVRPNKPPNYIKMCDPSVPHVQHPSSCSAFLHCQPAANGSWIYAEKSCGESMMFNPVSMTCDWPENVKAINPNCDTDPEVPILERVFNPCPVGYIFSECALPCGRTCHYYGQSLKLSGNCTAESNTCKKGCIPIGSVANCQYPKLWRDPNSCVSSADCTCMAENFQQLKPGEVVKISDCKTCQCISNEIICVDTPCSKPTPSINNQYKEVPTKSYPTQESYVPPSIITTPRPGRFIPNTYETRPCFLTLCDTTIPHVEHPFSCFKFLHCQPAPNGSWVFAEKTCGPDMMFNPVHMICDWPASVKAIKPNCETNPGETEVFTVCTVEQNQVAPTPKTPKQEFIASTPRRVPLPTKTPTKTQTKTQTKTPIPVTPSYATPPMQCDQSQIVPLMDKLPDSAITASSIYGVAFKPEAARLNSKASDGSSGSWSPSVNDKTQYLQITFPQLTPLYGVIVRGSVIFDQYVTSFKILHSFDGQTFHNLVDEQQNTQIFSGSVDSAEPVRSFFRVPIEAKVVRILPITWYQSISLKAELLGCQREFDIPTVPYNPTTPRTFVTPGVTPAKTIFTERPPVTQKPFTQYPFTVAPVIPMCDQPLGVESNKISPKQITFSSIKDPGTVKTKVRNNSVDVIKLSSPRGWMPLATSTNEFVQFDFLGNRNLTGVITKGGEYGWVKSFNVLYSKDNKIWNVLSANGKPFEFLANVDADTPKTNLFKHPINAQFLKIRPAKWSTAIEMKVEPLGCFEPYANLMELTTKRPNDEFEIVTPSTCGLCKNVLPPIAPVIQDTCTCYLPLLWNGQECVQPLQCPCMVGHMAYEVGVQFATEDCADCICKLGGESQCTPKVCQPCKQGTKRASPESCSCKCEKCPKDTVLCQSSGQCIPDELWCDGVVDCPDEINCIQTGTITTTTNTSTTILKKCPEVACPPGFEVKGFDRSRKSKMMSRFSDSQEDEQENEPPKQAKQPKQPQLYYIKANYQASYEAVLPISISAKGQNINEEECYKFMCVPIVDDTTDLFDGNNQRRDRCPEPKCPNGYMIKLQVKKSSSDCAKFTCEPFLENDAVCNVTGRTINTFDSTEFKYDFCTHLLARDTADVKWNVIVRKNCTGGNNVCTKEIEFKDKTSPYTMILYPTLDVKLDGYPFTVQQLQNSNKKSSFVVSKAGDTLLFVSHAHGVWITFDQYGDIKLGISPKYANQVDGLCGFFNNIKADDKQMPDGKLAASTVEFSNSWSLNQISKEDCEPHVCPQNLQDIAWKMCNLVNDESFKGCAKTVDPSRFVSTCIETACDCLKSASNGSTEIAPNDLAAYSKTCKCAMLKNYVVECMAADEDIRLETWRSAHGCEANCPAPLVHKDCYRRKCETTCNNIHSNDCTNVPGSCFSGCYCPEGMVRKDSTCVPIAECKDCVCDGFGKSQYLTYDRKNFTFDGNCTYLLTRDLTVENVHTFQVYATVGPCDPKANTLKKATCTQSLHLIYGSHLIHIQRGNLNNLDVIIDGFNQKKLPYIQKWIQITEVGKELNIKLPESNVELTSQFDTMSFSIKVPSLKFGNKMEGICGNCNGNPDDDLQINLLQYEMIDDPAKNSESKNFALSWLADEPKLGSKELKCHVEDVADCLPLPPDTDPCFKLLDETLFGKCHFVVEPIMFLTACQQDLCRTGPVQKGACGSIEAYARECARNGICVDWRRNGFCSMECAAPFIYNPCGCLETCDSMEIKNKRLQTSAIRDPTKLANIKATCDTTLSEGCFCPKGKVLRNGKCLFEKECKPCDDQGHFPGDIWHPDVCTDCKCKNDSTISCSTTKCPSQQTICSIGFIAIETAPTGECCKKYSCVAEPKSVQKESCPLLKFPKCNENQINKMINGTDGCSKYICDCIPKNQCKIPQNYTSLEPGFKKIIDSSGCCPTSKLVCDKSLCPQKPAQCTEAFYVMVTKAKTLNDQICCEIYECQPPPNGCVVTVGGQKYFKKIDDVWTTANPCVLESCAFDTNGDPKIKSKEETCNNICQPGYELKPIPNKCCGVCIKTKCVVDNKIYNVGQGWMSTDNCTRFTCNSKDDQTFIASEMESCPDISECADALKYIDGCCTKCKIETLQQQNCLAESLSEQSTIGLIRTVIPPHGLCKNVKGIRGLTECSGNCPSGTKFNPLTLLQNKDCHCCSVGSVREMTVPLLCEDNVKLNKVFSVPSACSCSVCGNDSDLKALKLTKATSK